MTSRDEKTLLGLALLFVWFRSRQSAAAKAKQRLDADQAKSRKALDDWIRQVKKRMGI